MESDVISQLIPLGANGARGSGHESWSCAVITDRCEIKRLSDVSKKHILENIESYPYFQQYRGRLNSEQFDVFFNAPCLLLIYGDSKPHWNVYECTFVAGNIMQDAMEYNLRACWIAFAEHVCDTEEFKSKYNILEHYKLVCTLSVGYPTVQLHPLS